MQRVLDLQVELWRKIASSNRCLVSADKPELQQALLDFDSSFPDSFFSIEEQAVLRTARTSPYLLIGDFHTLPAAQLQAARWLRRIKPRYLAVEIFSSNMQESVDRWSASSKPASALLEELSFARNWPCISPRGYLELLESARELGCRILAAEHPQHFSENPPGLEKRDAHFAQYLKQHGRGCTAMLVGDVHLRPTALPSRLGNATVVLHQNQAKYHFLMTRQGMEPPGYIQLAPRRYCWQGVHPLLVEESCLRSYSREEDAYLPQPAEWFAELAGRIGGLLEIEASPIPTLLTTHDPEQRSLLATIAKKPKQARRLIAALRIRGSEPISKETIVLHETGTNHVSEALGRWLLSTHIPETRQRSNGLLQVVADTRLESAGFLCSILVNPLRRPKPLLFYRDALGIEAQYHKLGDLARRLEEGISLGTLLGTEKWPKTISPEGMLLTRVVGQSLGSRLRSIWLQSDEKRGQVLELLTLPLESKGDLQGFSERLQSILS
ncbi:MAG: hypothetical protein CSA62_07660 [Planctomycetota bacterium]|nr:MAG: hypothetical protein CSA62_07660 [Planctomycetota bacterium]